MRHLTSASVSVRDTFAPSGQVTVTSSLRGTAASVRGSSELSHQTPTLGCSWAWAYDCRATFTGPGFSCPARAARLPCRPLGQRHPSTLNSRCQTEPYTAVSGTYDPNRVSILMPMLIPARTAKYRGLPLLPVKSTAQASSRRTRSILVHRHDQFLRMQPPSEPGYAVHFTTEASSRAFPQRVPGDSHSVLESVPLRSGTREQHVVVVDVAVGKLNATVIIAPHLHSRVLQRRFQVLGDIVGGKMAKCEPEVHCARNVPRSSASRRLPVSSVCTFLSGSQAPLVLSNTDPLVITITRITQLMGHFPVTAFPEHESELTTSKMTECAISFLFALHKVCFQPCTYRPVACEVFRETLLSFNEAPQVSLHYTCFHVQAQEIFGTLRALRTSVRNMSYISADGSNKMAPRRCSLTCQDEIQLTGIYLRSPPQR